MKNFRRIVFSVLTIFPFLCYGEENNPTDSSSQIQVIDSELELLRKKQHQLRLKSMQEEINNQPLMFEQWGKYADHIKESEKYEEKAHQVQQQIDILTAKRNQLFQENSLKSSEL